jgi:hypothetical protein
MPVLLALRSDTKRLWFAVRLFRDLEQVQLRREVANSSYTTLAKERKLFPTLWLLFEITFVHLGANACKMLNL